ncbi:hypothetical protein HMPREF1246_1558 [Acidaminococcus sp. BV3L6]|nr:hypothetical protein HMPREF1246_1558 [Acidaminococcus sp. BV3L6]
MIMASTFLYGVYYTTLPPDLCQSLPEKEGTSQENKRSAA